MIENSKDILRKCFHNGMIYLVTEEDLSNGKSTIDIVSDALRAGIKMIQLRDKSLSQQKRFQLALKLRELTLKYKALLFIDDSIDIALLAHADGVHLGQNDLPYSIVKSEFPDMLVGVSTHNKSEIMEALKYNIDYINVGPIFPTQTKITHQNFIGIDNLEELLSNITIPYSIMGGIKENNIPNLTKNKARIFAMVTEITKSNDVYNKCVQLLKVAQK